MALPVTGSIPRLRASALSLEIPLAGNLCTRSQFGTSSLHSKDRNSDSYRSNTLIQYATLFISRRVAKPRARLALFISLKRSLGRRTLSIPASHRAIRTSSVSNCASLASSSTVFRFLDISMYLESSLQNSQTWSYPLNPIYMHSLLTAMAKMSKHNSN